MSVIPEVEAERRAQTKMLRAAWKAAMTQEGFTPAEIVEVERRGQTEMAIARWRVVRERERRLNPPGAVRRKRAARDMSRITTCAESMKPCKPLRRSRSGLPTVFGPLENCLMRPWRQYQAHQKTLQISNGFG